MKFSVTALLIVACFPVVFMDTDYHPLSDEFINAINKEQSSWKAGRNFDIATPLSYINKLMGVDDRLPDEPVSVRNFHTAALRDLPESFDAREYWPKCQSLRHIRDQAACGSCWAVAAAAAMTDRICIRSNGNITTSVSADDLMTCCTSCGEGCDGGTVYGPWMYWKSTGISSGGDYQSNQGCKNYPFPSCATVPWSKKPKCGPLRQTPQCMKSCDSNGGLYTSQLTFGKSVYYLQNEDEIKRDIIENGPVEAAFVVYEDFPSYISGIYGHVRGKFMGRHAIKILGWGVENSTPYWLCANSWNEEWGDGGYFKMRRGVNECGIESSVYAGEPRL